MSLQGKVIQINETSVLVEVVPMPECQGCQACKGLLGEGNGVTTKQIKALKGNFNLEVGDEVLVDLNPGEGSVAAILVFGVPIAGFFAGLLATPMFCEMTGFALSDTARVLMGFAGMGIAFAMLAIFARSRYADKLSMKIMKKIEKHTASKT